MEPNPELLLFTLRRLQERVPHDGPGFPPPPDWIGWKTVMETLGLEEATDTICILHEAATAFAEAEQRRLDTSNNPPGLHDALQEMTLQANLEALADDLRKRSMQQGPIGMGAYIIQEATVRRQDGKDVRMFRLVCPCKKGGTSFFDMSEARLRHVYLNADDMLAAWQVQQQPSLLPEAFDPGEARALVAGFLTGPGGSPGQPGVESTEGGVLRWPERFTPTPNRRSAGQRPEGSPLQAAARAAGSMSVEAHMPRQSPAQSPPGAAPDGSPSPQMGGAYLSGGGGAYAGRPGSLRREMPQPVLLFPRQTPTYTDSMSLQESYCDPDTGAALVGAFRASVKSAQRFYVARRAQHLVVEKFMADHARRAAAQGQQRTQQQPHGAQLSGSDGDDDTLARQRRQQPAAGTGAGTRGAPGGAVASEQGCPRKRRRKEARPPGERQAADDGVPGQAAPAEAGRTGAARLRRPVIQDSFGISADPRTVEAFRNLGAALRARERAASRREASQQQGQQQQTQQQQREQSPEQGANALPFLRPADDQQSPGPRSGQSPPPTIGSPVPTEDKLPQPSGQHWHQLPPSPGGPAQPRTVRGLAAAEGCLATPQSQMQPQPQEEQQCPPSAQRTSPGSSPVQGPGQQGHLGSPARQQAAPPRQQKQRPLSAGGRKITASFVHRGLPRTAASSGHELGPEPTGDEVAAQPEQGGRPYKRPLPLQVSKPLGSPSRRGAVDAAAAGTGRKSAGGMQASAAGVEGAVVQLTTEPAEEEADMRPPGLGTAVDTTADAAAHGTASTGPDGAQRSMAGAEEAGVPVAGEEPGSQPTGATLADGAGVDGSPAGRLRIVETGPSFDFEAPPARLTQPSPTRQQPAPTGEDVAPEGTRHGAAPASQVSGSQRQSVSPPTVEQQLPVRGQLQEGDQLPDEGQQLEEAQQREEGQQSGEEQLPEDGQPQQPDSQQHEPRSYHEGESQQKPGSQQGPASQQEDQVVLLLTQAGEGVEEQNPQRTPGEQPLVGTGASPGEPQHHVATPVDLQLRMLASQGIQTSQSLLEGWLRDLRVPARELLHCCMAVQTSQLPGLQQTLAVAPSPSQELQEQHPRHEKQSSTQREEPQGSESEAQPEQQPEQQQQLSQQESQPEPQPEQQSQERQDLEIPESQQLNVVAGLSPKRARTDGGSQALSDDRQLPGDSPASQAALQGGAVAGVKPAGAGRGQKRKGRAKAKGRPKSRPRASQGPEEVSAGGSGSAAQGVEEGNAAVAAKVAAVDIPVVEGALSSGGVHLPDAPAVAGACAAAEVPAAEASNHTGLTAHGPDGGTAVAAAGDAGAAAAGAAAPIAVPSAAGGDPGDSATLAGPPSLKLRGRRRRAPKSLCGGLRYRRLVRGGLAWEDAQAWLGPHCDPHVALPPTKRRLDPKELAVGVTSWPDAGMMVLSILHRPKRLNAAASEPADAAMGDDGGNVVDHGYWLPMRVPSSVHPAREEAACLTLARDVRGAPPRELLEPPPEITAATEPIAAAKPVAVETLEAVMRRRGEWIDFAAEVEEEVQPAETQHTIGQDSESLNAEVQGVESWGELPEDDEEAVGKLQDIDLHGEVLYEDLIMDKQPADAQAGGGGLDAKAREQTAGVEEQMNGGGDQAPQQQPEEQPAIQPDLAYMDDPPVVYSQEQDFALHSAPIDFFTQPF